MLTQRTKRRGCTGLLLILVLILGGCQGNQTAISETTPVVSETTAAQTAPPAQQVAEAPTAVPSPTKPPATVTPTQQPPTATPTTKPTRTPTPAVPTDTSTPIATETPTSVPADAVVTAPQLNVRSGPGTAFGAVAALVKDDTLEVIGQSDTCAWLQVRTTGDVEGWVAHVVGGKEYALLNIPCDSIPEVVVPTPTLPPQPTSPPTVPAPPPAAPTATPESGLPPDMGCYLIQNQLGVELTFTIQAVTWNWRETFRVPAMTDMPYCLGPGRYNYTIDAPPPWSSLNGTLDVVAGDRLLWPIRGRE